MSASEFARRRLPAPMQDWLRSALDLLSPRRGRSAARADDLATEVSPNGTVLSGPFKGLRLSLDATWGGNAARVAGTYESEIQSVVEDMIAARPGLVVDVGAAEGYYATGLARRLPGSRIVSFELERAARVACSTNARLNNITNLTVRGRATPSALARVIEPGAALICDIEGFEDVLMDPAAIEDLRQCTLLIELHEFAVPGVTSRLCARFADSHGVELIDARPRTAEDVSSLLGHMSADQALLAVQEGRPTDPPMQWAFMTPRVPANPA